MSRSGWIIALVSLGGALLFAVVVGGWLGVGHLAGTFGRYETEHEKLEAVKTARIRMLSIRNAVEFYIYDTGQAPLSLQDLVSRPQGDVAWNGPYIRRGLIPTGPWGREFRYEPAPNGFHLSSAGFDRIFDATEMASLSEAEVHRRLAAAGMPVPPPPDYDPEADNIYEFHYHLDMENIVPPGTPLRAQRMERGSIFGQPAPALAPPPRAATSAN